MFYNPADFNKKDFDWQQFLGKPFYKHYPERKNMAYNKFSFEETLEKFNLKSVKVKSIVENFEPYPASELLKATLVRGLSAVPRTEKARSEFLIAPILLEIFQIKSGEISLFSGIEFKVDPKNGLNGRCDFIFSFSPETRTLVAPAITIVEAKKADTDTGIGQCIAEMYAAQLFNERKGKPVRTIYGSITTATNWLFLKLEDKTVFIEETERLYDLNRNLDELIGLLLKITEVQH